eukprot:scaffold24271_cov112-Isochrysis_galbana.AAC.2
MDNGGVLRAVATTRYYAPAALSRVAIQRCRATNVRAPSQRQSGPAPAAAAPLIYPPKKRARELPFPTRCRAPLRLPEPILGSHVSCRRRAASPWLLHSHRRIRACRGIEGPPTRPPAETACTLPPRTAKPPPAQPLQMRGKRRPALLAPTAVLGARIHASRARRTRRWSPAAPPPPARAPLHRKLASGSGGRLCKRQRPPRSPGLAV